VAQPGEVWEYKGLGRKQVLRVVEHVPGGVRCEASDRPGGKGVLLAEGELEEHGRRLFAARAEETAS
jgi:hypothetical protein